MEPKKSVLFIAYTFALSLPLALGCATTQPVFEPMDIPTLGELVADSDTMSDEPSLKTALRLALDTKYANGVEACVVSRAKADRLEASRNASHTNAAKNLALAFSGGDVEMLKSLPTRMNWWPSDDNITCFTQLCVVPPKTDVAERAFSSLPGHQAPTSPAETKPEVLTVRPLPTVEKSPKTIFEIAAGLEPGAAFTYDSQLCSVGNVEIAEARRMNEAQELSMFLAASNVLGVLDNTIKKEIYDNDTALLLKAATRREWKNIRKDALAAVVCIIPPSNKVAAAQ